MSTGKLAALAVAAGAIAAGFFYPPPSGSSPKRPWDGELDAP